jgi:hypothetical protein
LKFSHFKFHILRKGALLVSRIRIWLYKKKTYFSAGALALVACLGYFGGILDGTNALALLTFAGGLAGLGAKSQRTADQLLAVLDDVRNAQARAALDHKRIDLRQLAKEVAKELSPAVVAGMSAQPIAHVPVDAVPSGRAPRANRRKPNSASQKPRTQSQAPMEGQR